MYEKTIWHDQNVERPRTYDFTQNEDGSFTLLDSFGEVTDLGTPVNAQNMNKIEEGIENLDINKLDTSLLNLSNEGKDNIMSFVCPDYSRGTSKTSNTMYEALYPEIVIAQSSVGGPPIGICMTRVTGTIYDPSGVEIASYGNASAKDAANGSGNGSAKHASIVMIVPKNYKYKISVMNEGTFNNSNASINSYPMTAQGEN